MSHHNDQIFDILPANSRIPASAARVVALMRSDNAENIAFDGPMVRAKANLVVVYTLRGTYALYVYFNFTEQQGGLLMGGMRSEAPIARYGEIEKKALNWLEQAGFHMRPLILNTLDAQERYRALLDIPFAINHNGDATQGTGGVITEGSAPPMLSTLAAGQDLGEVLRQLKALLVAG